MFPCDPSDRRDRASDSRQEQVDAVVAAIVAEFGFKIAIPWLLHTVAKMAEMSLSLPTDKRCTQQFQHWSNAVQTACQREGVLRRSFDQLVSFEDRSSAREIGVRLE